MIFTWNACPKFRKEKKKRFMDREHGAAHSCLLIDNLFSVTFEKNVSKKRIEVWERKKSEWSRAATHTRRGKRQDMVKKKKKNSKKRKPAWQRRLNYCRDPNPRIKSYHPSFLNDPLSPIPEIWGREFNYFYLLFQFFNRKLINNIFASR